MPPIVPIPTSYWDAFWLTWRFLTQLSFIVGVFAGMRILSMHTKTMRAVLASLHSKEQILAELKATADALAIKTAAVVARTEARDAELKQKMDENTDITRAAASAATAANDKIAKTQEHLERALPPKADVVNAVTEQLQQIEHNTATIAKNTEKPEGIK